MLDQISAEDDEASSKKDPEIRAQEIRSAVSPALVKYTLENMKSMLRDNELVVFLTCLLNFGDGMEPCLSQLAEEAAKPFCKGDDEVFFFDFLIWKPLIKNHIYQDVFKIAQTAITISFYKL